MLGRVNTHELLSALDTEIVRLQHARTLIAGSAEPKRRGRPPASPKAVPKKRTMSAEGRKRIADAQRKRWAAQKKQKTVKVTRVAAKEAPKRRVAKPAAKRKNALSGIVSNAPVAAAAKANA